MPIIHTQHISLSLSGTPVVTDVSLEVGHGEFVGIVGPNGSGKTTLLRGLHRALKPQAGAVLVGMDD